MVINFLFTDVKRRYSAKYVKEYIEGSKPAFCVGEYWDSCSYNGTYLNYNQGISPFLLKKFLINISDKYDN